MQLLECCNVAGSFFPLMALMVIVTVIFVEDGLVGLFSILCLGVLWFTLKDHSFNFSCYLPAEIKWRQG